MADRNKKRSNNSDDDNPTSMVRTVALIVVRFASTSVEDWSVAVPNPTLNSGRGVRRSENQLMKGNCVAFFFPFWRRVARASDRFPSAESVPVHHFQNETETKQNTNEPSQRRRRP